MLITLFLGTCGCWAKLRFRRRPVQFDGESFSFLLLFWRGEKKATVDPGQNGRACFFFFFLSSFSMEGGTIRWGAGVGRDAGMIAVGDTQAVRDQPSQRITDAGSADPLKPIPVADGRRARVKRQGRRAACSLQLQPKTDHGDFQHDDSTGLAVPRWENAEALYPEGSRLAPRKRGNEAADINEGGGDRPRNWPPPPTPSSTAANRRTC